MSRTDELERLIAPLVQEAGLELIDVELVPHPTLLRVSVDAEGGIDFDRLAEVSRKISQLVEESDAAPRGHYDLEVSSPGLERSLRRPEHFHRAVGQQVKVRTLPGTPGTRRTEGLLAAADDDGITVTTADAGERRVAYSEIERARTVFDWQGARSLARRQGSEAMSTTNFEFLDALQQIARDKGISVDTLLDVLANALVAAYKRLPDAAEEAVVTIDPDSGEIRVYGQELDEEGTVIREWDDTPEDFGRIAAQTAKQVITQRIREAARDLMYEEYAGREGDLVTGIIQQSDNRYTLLDLGRVEALLPQAEQVPYERYDHGARLKAYIVEVRKTTKGPQIIVSRSHPGLIKRLFELEVPEISNGVVEIKAAAREPGHRTKIAVWSNDQNVDPVGASVGPRGARVRMVMNELRGEKIDVVAYVEDPAEFVAQALQPARVRDVRLDDDSGTATVIVHDSQLSLAIGKEGQNARLTARLTGWRVDIKSESQLAEEEAVLAEAGGWAEGEWVESPGGEMVWQPAEGGEAVSIDEWAHGGQVGGGEQPGAEAAAPAGGEPGGEAKDEVKDDGAKDGAAKAEAKSENGKDAAAAEAPASPAAPVAAPPAEGATP